MAQSAAWVRRGVSRVAAVLFGRATTTVALFAATVVALSGCSGDDGGTPAPSPKRVFEAAPCPSPNVASIPQLNLGPDFSCGFLTVPENRSRPDGRTVKLAVARVKAASPDPEPDPLVYLTGGPGGPATAVAQLLANRGINRDRDVIFVAQRGTLHSDPFLVCPGIDRFVAASTATSVLAPETAAADLAAVTECHDALTSAGYDLAAYDTTENAADVADLRTALGIGDWNVYGVSYGSDLALQLLRDHPDGIRSVTIDSVVPPQVNVVSQFWLSAAEGYQALFDACTAQPTCNAAYPRLRDEFTDTVRKLAEKPLIVDVPNVQKVVIDGYTLANVVVQSSLLPNGYAGLPKAIHEIAAGDGAAIARILLSTISPPSLTGYGLTYGVFCREHVASAELNPSLARASGALPEFPIPVLTLLPQAPRLYSECAVWDVGEADQAVHRPTVSDVPVLVMTGTLDAVTPPSQADLAAKTLSRSRVVRFGGLGHDVLASSDCAMAMLTEFLERPEGYSTACAEALRPPEFS